MSKRKNLSKYYPTVQMWDKFICMDKNGDWNLTDAKANYEYNPNEGEKALTNAIDECINGFKTNASCPALDMVYVLLDEANDINVNCTLIDTLRLKTKQEWEKERQKQNSI